MVRTRVGYTGGRRRNPTYYFMGDHTETLQIDYDPSVLSFEQIMWAFWHSHNPTRPKGSRQYMSAIFYHDDAQKTAALKTMVTRERELGQKIVTAFQPAETFYLAEDYHQKYMVQSRHQLMKEFRAMYPDFAELNRSTAVARANGFVYHNGGDVALLRREIGLYGLSDAAQKQLLDR